MSQDSKRDPNPFDSAKYRTELLYKNDIFMRKQLHMTPRVMKWINHYFDELLHLYSICTEMCQNDGLPILDQSNFMKFCAAMAGLSSIDYLIDEPERSLSTRFLNATLKPQQQQAHTPRGLMATREERLEKQAGQVLEQMESEWPLAESEEV